MSRPFGRMIFADSAQPGEKYMVVRGQMPEGMRWLLVHQASMTTLQIHKVSRFRWRCVLARLSLKLFGRWG